MEEEEEEEIGDVEGGVGGWVGFRYTDGIGVEWSGLGGEGRGGDGMGGGGMEWNCFEKDVLGGCWVFLVL